MPWIDYVDNIVAPALIGGKSVPTLADGQTLDSVSELSKIGVLKLLKCSVLCDSYLRLRYQVVG